MDNKIQLCPKCNGQGTVSKPPWVAGDVHEWVSSSTSFVCNLCNGLKYLVLPIPEEPVKERWAVVQVKRIYNSKLIADMDCEEYNDRQSRYDLDAKDIDKFTVVKLAE